MASSPRIITQTCNSDVRRRSFEEKPVSLFIVPPCAQASRRCETQATLRRQAAKLRQRFGPLDPFRALREPDRRRRYEERPFPLRTKNCQQTQTNNQRIDCPATGGKAP